jgi:hypothetical protein
MLAPKPSKETLSGRIEPVAEPPLVRTTSDLVPSRSSPEKSDIESTAMMVGQGLESGSTGEPGCSQLDVGAGFDSARPQAPWLARWRAWFYQSRLLDILTHIVVLHAGANLLGALAVILPVIFGLVLTIGDKATNPALGRGFLVLWAMALVLGDGAVRWGQPRAGRIQRWISPYHGACFLFFPCWILGSAFLTLAAWPALHAP